MAFACVRFDGHENLQFRLAIAWPCSRRQIAIRNEFPAVFYLFRIMVCGKEWMVIVVKVNSFNLSRPYHTKDQARLDIGVDVFIRMIVGQRHSLCSVL